MVGSPKKILILAANPLNTVKLRLEKEVSEIRTSLQLSANRDRFEIEARGAVSPDDLQQYMYDLKPQIVHFSGHGVGVVTSGDEPSSTRKLEVVSDQDSQPEGLVLENKIGQSKLVSGAALSNLFALFRQQVECVVLNACYSQQQAQEIVKHIPYVVGMRQAIGDEAARKFAQGFYRAIWDDRSIEDAFLSGKNAIELEGIPEELTPVLLKRADVPKPPPHPWRIIARLRTGLFISLGTTIAISLTRFTGILQPLELNVYDYTLRSRPAEKPDPRLLIVTVTEADLQLQTQAQEPRRGSLSDRSLAQLLETLASDRPIAIGLDIYRDFPVSKSEPALANRLRAKDSAPSIVGVCQVSDADHGDPGVAPPPELS